jgi:hypothetical protein
MQSAKKATNNRPRVIASLINTEITGYSRVSVLYAVGFLNNCRMTGQLFSRRTKSDRINPECAIDTLEASTD